MKEMRYTPTYQMLLGLVLIADSIFGLIMFFTIWGTPVVFYAVFALFLIGNLIALQAYFSMKKPKDGKLQPDPQERPVEEHPPAADIQSEDK